MDFARWKNRHSLSFLIFVMRYVRPNLVSRIAVQILLLCFFCIDVLGVHEWDKRGREEVEKECTGQRMVAEFLASGKNIWTELSCFWLDF